MNRHAAAGHDETTSQPHHELQEQIGQLEDRERVLISENDQLRAQLVEMKEQEKKKYDDLMVQYNMKREYEDEGLDTVDRDGMTVKEEIKEEGDGLDNQGTSNNQVAVKTEWDHEEVKVQIKEEEHDIIIKREYEDDGLDRDGTSNNQVTVKTEWDDDEEVKVEIKEEFKEEEDHDIIIKQEYVPAYIKTESDDVKVEIKEEIKEEEDEDDYDDDRGCDLGLVKKELVSDDEDNSMQFDDQVNVDDEVQVNLNEPIDILSRDQLNSPTHSVFELSPSANCQMQLTNSSQIEQSVDQQVDRADHELNEPVIDGQNESPSTKQSSSRKRKRTATTNCQVSTPGPKKKSKRTRVSSLLDRTKTVQEVSTSVAVDLREMDEQNGGGEGLGQTEEDDDETELGEEDGGHYKIVIVKLKCTEDGCEDEVADCDKLHDHLRSKHHISPFRCLAVGCGERFEQWNELGPHVTYNHSNISNWPCTHCTKTFQTQNRLYNHLHYYHFEGQFKCGYDACHYDRVATFRSAILAHQKSVHPKTTTFTCQFPNCGKSFKQKGNFNRHQQSHSGVKLFPCEVTGCGKSFALMQHLNNHQRIHQKVKPFKCTWNMCGYAATQQTNVITHIRTQHFNLPATQKAQRELGIEDNRNPRDYLQQ